MHRMFRSRSLMRRSALPTDQGIYLLSIKNQGLNKKISLQFSKSSKQRSRLVPASQAPAKSLSETAEDKSSTLKLWKSLRHSDRLHSQRKRRSAALSMRSTVLLTSTRALCNPTSRFSAGSTNISGSSKHWMARGPWSQR